MRVRPRSVGRQRLALVYGAIALVLAIGFVLRKPVMEAIDAGVKQSLRGLGNARATRVGEEYRMVGNAVPPLLATRVGDAFLRANFSPVSDDESA